MKKILSSRIIILFAVIGFFVTGCQWNSTDSDTLIKSKDGIYHIKGSPKLLELKMGNGGILAVDGILAEYCEVFIVRP